MTDPKVILVIDDRQLVLAILMQALETEGYEVIGAETASEGLELAQRYVPDLILSDYRLEGSDGLQLLASIRRDSRTAAIPFVLVTVDEDPELKQRAKEMGVQAFLSKPFEMEDLVDIVKRYIGHTPETLSV